MNAIADPTTVSGMPSCFGGLSPKSLKMVLRRNQQPPGIVGTLEDAPDAQPSVVQNHSPLNLVLNRKPQIVGDAWKLMYSRYQIEVSRL